MQDASPPQAIMAAAPTILYAKIWNISLLLNWYLWKKLLQNYELQ
jgi:hypothetical protein